MRELNEQIRTIAAGNGDDDAYIFICECGCWSELRLTVSEYEARGRALRPGHDG